ncbi:hypothetical protein [Streptomyces sp. rh34]|uniref:hypothetical protein n=1 Tax=Streptomyces sp. rh34 TaxID=2034272 RepID=UPI0015CF72EB|nr:hypothetical protein [Streptomyces sp. rh34]
MTEPPLRPRRVRGDDRDHEVPVVAPARLVAPVRYEAMKPGGRAGHGEHLAR